MAARDFFDILQSRQKEGNSSVGDTKEEMNGQFMIGLASLCVANFSFHKVMESMAIRCR